MDQNHSFCYEAQLEPYNCEQCKFKNHFLINLRLHFESEDTTDMDPYLCQDCDFTTFSQLMILLHQKNCSMANTQKKDLKAHILLERTLDKAIRKWFHCDACYYKTRTKANYQSHLLCHVKPEETDWFRCDQCSFKTKWPSAVRRHKVNKHTAEDLIRWFQCERCSYKAKTKGNLQSHMLSHLKPEEIKWIYCEECGFRAKRTSDLRKHKVSKHSAEGDI